MECFCTWIICWKSVWAERERDMEGREEREGKIAAVDFIIKCKKPMFHLNAFFFFLFLLFLRGSPNSLMTILFRIKSVHAPKLNHHFGLACVGIASVCIGRFSIDYGNFLLVLHVIWIYRHRRTPHYLQYELVDQRVTKQFACTFN